MSELFEDPIFDDCKEMEVGELSDFVDCESLIVENLGTIKQDQSIKIEIDNETQLQIKKLKSELLDYK